MNPIVGNKIESIRLFIQRYQKIFALILALVILVAGYLIVLKEPLRIYLENAALLSNLQNEIKVARVELANAQDYSVKLYQPTAEETRWLNMSLPDKPDFSSLIENLTVLARRSGFTVANIDIEEVNGRASLKSNQSNIGKISVRLKLNGGGYEELKRFMTLTESSLMMIDVSSINFSSKTPTYDLSLIVYYYRQQ